MDDPNLTEPDVKLFLNLTKFGSSHEKFDVWRRPRALNITTKIIQQVVVKYSSFKEKVAVVKCVYRPQLF